MRVSMPGAPFGIFEKSSWPSSFCPFMQNGQWSVDDDLQVVHAGDRARAPPALPFARIGGIMTYLAPSKPGSS